jgi:hypothetical protein
MECLSGKDQGVFILFCQGIRAQFEEKIFVFPVEFISDDGEA